MSLPDEIKPAYHCPKCHKYPMAPSYHAEGYFYYLCRDWPECGGRRGFKMTRFNMFRDVMRPKSIE